MTFGCLRASVLLERSASNLRDAERLALETHLAECTRCAEQASLLRVMVESAKSAEHALDAPARARAIREALRAVRFAPRPAAQSQPRRRWPRVLAMAAVAGALVGTGAWLMAFRESEPQGPPVAAAVPKRDAGGFASLPPPHAAPNATASIEAPAGTRLDLENARVTALATSELAWHAAETTLQLTRGSVRVDVEPRAGSSFRVRTQKFTVEVVGTVFEVDTGGVRVIQGKVRTLETGSGKLLATLEAGRSWSIASNTKIDGGAPVDVAAQIGRARRLVAGRQIALARSALRDLLKLSLASGQRAEALSLLAECSLIEGDPATAAEIYSDVAERHRGSLAGETASFAQARAELRAGRRDAARASFRRYVTRYPAGRFSKEALRHLGNLEETP